MKFIKKYWDPICLTIIIGMAAIVLLSTFAVFDVETVKSVKANMYMAGLFSGMVVYLILFTSVYFDKRISDATYYFMCLISFGFLCLLTDFVYWHNVEQDLNDLFFRIFYILDNLAVPFLLFLLVHYEKNILNISDRDFRPYENLMFVIMFVNIAVVITNAFTEVVFKIEYGVFHSNAFGLLTLLMPFIISLICVRLTVVYSENRKHSFIVTGCIFLPTVPTVLMLPAFSTTILFLSITIATVIMFGEVYLNRGWEIINSKISLAERKIAIGISRIEPDFLEEALDSIAAIEGTPDDTRIAIVEFKKYLKENIDTITQTKPIHIMNELEHVITYVNLEKLRFKDKLNVKIYIGDRNFYLPAMTLQMITENAIKHGITQREEGGTVTIKAVETEEAHIIIVTDDGVGFNISQPRDQSRSHLGLDNLSTRLRELVDGTFTIESIPGEGTVATVVIPKK